MTYQKSLFPQDEVKPYLETRLVNFHHYGSVKALNDHFGDRWLYIGRGNNNLGLLHSFVANRWSHVPVSNAIHVATAEESVSLFRDWIWNEIKSGNKEVCDLLVDIASNKRVLVCWCREKKGRVVREPKPCHGYVVLKAADWFYNQIYGAKIIDGDLVKLALSGEFDIIVHGCNCFGMMGRGIALQIKQAFPEAYKADLETTKGDIDKLGTYSMSTVYRSGIHINVINAYTQFRYGTQEQHLDYDAVNHVFAKIKDEFGGKNKRIGYPQIGAGLGGGDWSMISEIIDQKLKGENHTLVRYKPN